MVLLRLEDERVASEIATLQQLLEKHLDRLADTFVVVTENRVRFARLRRDFACIPTTLFTHHRIRKSHHAFQCRPVTQDG